MKFVLCFYLPDHITCEAVSGLEAVNGAEADWRLYLDDENLKISRSKCKGGNQPGFVVRFA